MCSLSAAGDLAKTIQVVISLSFGFATAVLKPILLERKIFISYLHFKT